MGPEEGQLCAKCAGAVLERSCGHAEPGRSRPWTPTKPRPPRPWSALGIQRGWGSPNRLCPTRHPSRTSLDPSLPGRSPRVRAQHTLRGSLGACGLTDGTPCGLPGNAGPVQSAEQSRSGTQIPSMQRGHRGIPLAGALCQPAPCVVRCEDPLPPPILKLPGIPTSLPHSSGLRSNSPVGCTCLQKGNCPR